MLLFIFNYHYLITIMDFNKLALDLNAKVYTDVKIFLTNNLDTIEMDVHKVVLAFTSDFFNSLFKFGLEKNKSEVTVVVDDVKIAQQVILSFYGKEIIYQDIVHKLKVMICQDYFCQEIDKNFFTDINIPDYLFELFFSFVTSRFELDDVLMRSIKDNIPNNYDLKKIPSHLIKKLLNIPKYYIIAGGQSQEIYLYEPYVKKRIIIKDTTIDNKDVIMWSDISNDCTKIVAGYDSGKILVYDKCGNILFNLNDHAAPVKSVQFSKDNQKIVSSCENGIINIWNYQSGCYNIQTKIDVGSSCWAAMFFSDNERIVSCHTSRINIWNVNNGLLIKKLVKNTGDANCMALSNNNKIIAYANININLIDVTTGNLLHQINNKSNIICVNFSSDDSKLIASGYYCVFIFDVNSGILLKNFKINHGGRVIFLMDSTHFLVGDNYNFDIIDYNSGTIIDSYLSSCPSPLLFKAYPSVSRSVYHDLDIKLQKCISDD